jgi:RNA polymerase sigma factor (sigma-70 family)
MNAAELFEKNLALIDNVVGVVCRRAHIFGADAEDFESQVKLALIEDDYGILRKYEGRASLGAFLSIVIQRLLYDQRTRALGRWHASREAERLGGPGVLLEKLIRRDGRSLDEAFPLLKSIDPSLTREQVAGMASRLPERAGRPRFVALDEEVEIAAPDSAEGLAVEAERRSVARSTTGVIRDTLARMNEEDRMIIRFHFGSSMGIASISRMLRLPQRPLYRRLEAILQRMRSALALAGIEGRDLAELIGAATADMDFGLEDGKSDGARQSSSIEETPAAEESR